MKAKFGGETVTHFVYKPYILYIWCKLTVQSGLHQRSNTIMMEQEGIINHGTQNEEVKKKK